jgi:hypothetical protein
MPNSQFGRLNDSNFIKWKYQIEAYLTQKELWEVVNGSDNPLTGSVNLKAIKVWVKK